MIQNGCVTSGQEMCSTAKRGEIGGRIEALAGELRTIRNVISGIEDRIYIPRPVNEGDCCPKEKPITINQQLDELKGWTEEIFKRLNGINQTLAAQLDDETKLV